MEMDVVHRKGIFLSLFSGLRIWELEKKNKLQILQKVYKNVAPSLKAAQSAAALG